MHHGSTRSIVVIVALLPAVGPLRNLPQDHEVEIGYAIGMVSNFLRLNCIVALSSSYLAAGCTVSPEVSSPTNTDAGDSATTNDSGTDRPSDSAVDMDASEPSVSDGKMGPRPWPDPATPSLQYPYEEPDKYHPFGTYAVFNEVAGDSVVDSINEEVIRLIDATPSGSTIYGAQYRLSYRPVFDALKRAKARGTHVRLVIDGLNNKNEGIYAEIVNAGFDSVTFCPKTVRDDGTEGGGCIGERFMHNKIWLFSYSEDREGIPHGRFVSTATVQASVQNAWNSQVVFYGSDSLYHAYYRYFGLLEAHERNPDFRETSDGYYFDHPVNGGGTSGWSVAFAPSDGGLDDVATALAAVNSAEPGCRLYVAHSQFNYQRGAVADQMARIALLGCSVRLLYDHSDDKVLGRLDVPGSETRHYSDGEGTSLHDKFVVYEGEMGGEPQRRIVLMGSHNLSWSTLHVSDENLLHIEGTTGTDGSSEVVDDFIDHFERMWQRSAP